MRFRYWILTMIASLSVSCVREGMTLENGSEEETSDLVTEVSASLSGFTVSFSRADENSGASDAASSTTKKTVKDTDSEDPDYILGMKEFQEGDKIYILQRGSSLMPKFPGDFFDHRNDTDEEYKTYREKNNLKNIYVYEYNPAHDPASWGDGYNFKLKPNWSDPIKWSDVKSNGSIGNSFVFYAFCDNLKDLEPYSDDPLLAYWKSTGAAIDKNDPITYFHHAYGGKWKKSDNVGNNYDYSNDWHVYQYQNHCGVPDFMGAYHTTSTLYSRPRFKFYHLLAYVRVTLYVPVVEKYQDGTITGFDETAFVLTNDGSGNGTDAEINDYRAGVSIGYHPSANRVLRTRFTIDWSANRSSDKDAPLTQTLDVANTAGFLYYYCMYFHNPLDITDLRYKPKKAEEDYKAIKAGIGEEDLDVTEFVAGSENARKYLTPQKDNAGNTKYIDRVRRYEFSAAMPEQSIPTSGTVGGKTATSTLVDIHVRNQGTGIKKTYNGTKDNFHNNFAEYTLSAKNFIEGANDFELKQGTITHLHIYLPRVSDEAILVRAEVRPWNETHTDMTVAPEEW